MKFLFLGVMSDESVSNMHTTSFDKRKAMADVVANGAGGSLIDMLPSTPCGYAHQRGLARCF